MIWCFHLFYTFYWLYMHIAHSLFLYKEFNFTFDGFSHQLCASRAGSGDLGVLTIPCQDGPKVFFYHYNHCLDDKGSLDVLNIADCFACWQWDVEQDLKSWIVFSGRTILDNPASSRLWIPWPQFWGDCAWLLDCHNWSDFQHPQPTLIVNLYINHTQPEY